MKYPYDDIINSTRKMLDPFQGVSNKILEIAMGGSKFNSLFSTINGIDVDKITGATAFRDSIKPFLATQYVNPLGDLGINLGFDGFFKQFADIPDIIGQMYPLPNFDAFTKGLFFKTLPDLSPILAGMERFSQQRDDGEEALTSAGYTFLTNSVVLSAFSAYKNVHPRARPAAVTNTLLALTRSDEFVTDLEGLMESSPLLARRLPPLRAAMRAHKGKDYFLSIPVLLAQVEGLIADALIVKGAIREKDKKLYVLDTKGEIQIGKDNKTKVTVSGLKPLVERSAWTKHSVLAGVAGLAADSLAPDRNAILHGRRHLYAQPKLSLVTLLAIYVIASEFADLEKAVNSI